MNIICHKCKKIFNLGDAVFRKVAGTDDKTQYYFCKSCAAAHDNEITELKPYIREKPETKKSCFICNNMNLCKHFDHYFYKSDTDFLNNFISELGDLIAKHCKKFNQFQDIEKPDTGGNIDVCKWKISSEALWRYESDCGIVAPSSYFKRDYKWKLGSNAVCQRCGKKVEVVE